MSENNVNGITGADVATTTGIVGATVAIGQYIINDYVITIAEAEGDYGYTMTITRGTDTQTVTLYGLTPEQYASMLGYLEQAQAAAQSAEGSASDASVRAISASDAANRALNFTLRAERASDSARSYETQAKTAKQDAETAKTQAQGYKQDAEAAATRAETAAEQITGMTAEAETLEPGSPATASFLDGVLSLGIPAGENGADGNGIVSIVKTGTSGNLDTYTITYTNGTTSTFTVTNGVDGAVTSVAGKTGAVTLDAGDMAFDDQQAYNDGTVGAGLTNLKSHVNTLYDAEYYELAHVTGWDVVAQTSYQQLLFNNKLQKDIRPYIVRLVTNAAIGFTKIEFRNTSNSTVATISDSNGYASPQSPYYMAINPTGTLKISRIRLYGASAAAKINLEFYDFSKIANANTNASKSLDYISNFAVNKVTPEWISGKYVSVGNPSYPYDGSGYSICNFDVTKGDIIRVIFPSDSNVPDSGKGVLSERIVYGSGDYSYGFRVLLKGSSSISDYLYIAEKDMSLTVTGINTSNGIYLPDIYAYSVYAYKVSKDFASERYNQFEYNKVTNKMQIGKASRNGYSDSYPKPLTLLHYSDAHNGFQNVQHIKEFGERFKSYYLDDIICTGDMAGNTYYSYYPIYGLDGYKNIMLCIGNHDVYDVNGDAESHGVPYDSPEYWATNLQKYNQYFAPSIAEWGVTQPANAETLGLCYYYKDYESNGYAYRLIVLDAMAFDDAQYNWLVETLTDAKTNSMTVVIADHFPPITGLSDINGFNTPFMSLLTGMEFSYVVTRLTTSAGSAVDAVDDFISNNGDFACWICGHMHYDQIGTLVSHPNQIYVAVASAKDTSVWLDQPRTAETESCDCFNIISIDPRLKVIKIQRIGATIDDWGRVHDHVSVNYATKTLIATS